MNWDKFYENYYSFPTELRDLLEEHFGKYVIDRARRDAESGLRKPPACDFDVKHNVRRRLDPKPIIDYLRKNPNSTATEITDGMKLDFLKVSGQLISLTREGLIFKAVRRNVSTSGRQQVWEYCVRD